MQTLREACRSSPKLREAPGSFRKLPEAFRSCPKLHKGDGLRHQQSMCCTETRGGVCQQKLHEAPGNAGSFGKPYAMECYCMLRNIVDI